MLMEQTWIGQSEALSEIDTLWIKPLGVALGREQVFPIAAFSGSRF